MSSRGRCDVPGRRAAERMATVGGPPWTLPVSLLSVASAAPRSPCLRSARVGVRPGRRRLLRAAFNSWRCTSSASPSSPPPSAAPCCSWCRDHAHLARPAAAGRRAARSPPRPWPAVRGRSRWACGPIARWPSPPAAPWWWRGRRSSRRPRPRGRFRAPRGHPGSRRLGHRHGGGMVRRRPRARRGDGGQHRVAVPRGRSRPPAGRPRGGGDRGVDRRHHRRRGGEARPDVRPGPRLPEGSGHRLDDRLACLGDPNHARPGPRDRTARGGRRPGAAGRVPRGPRLRGRCGPAPPAPPGGAPDPPRGGPRGDRGGMPHHAGGLGGRRRCGARRHPGGAAHPRGARRGGHGGQPLQDGADAGVDRALRPPGRHARHPATGRPLPRTPRPRGGGRVHAGAGPAGGRGRRPLRGRRAGRRRPAHPVGARHRRRGGGCLTHAARSASPPPVDDAPVPTAAAAGTTRTEA